MKKNVRILFLLCIFNLSACAILSSENTKKSSTEPRQQVSTQLNQNEGSEKTALDPNLPNVDLDQATLEQLLIQNFSSYNGDWKVASSNGLLAAKSSGDYRLARTSTLLALQGNDYEKALEGAELWNQTQPDSSDAVNVLIITQVASNLVEAALATIEKQGQDLDFDEHIKKTAGLMVRQKNASSALAVMNDFVVNNPESAQARLSGAYVAAVFEEFEQAQAWLDRAMEKKPDWDSAAQMKADILQRQGKVEEFLFFVEQYAQDHPNSVQMNIRYATNLARQERFEEALSLMQRMLEIAPDDSTVANNAGIMAQQLGDSEQAKKYYQRALNIDPKNDNARWSLGRLAVIEKKYVTAERLFNDVSAQESFIRAQIQVANARYHTKGLRRALDTLELLEPSTQAEYIDIALTRHDLLLRDYKYEEALGYVNEVLLYLPDNLDLLYSRALVAAELRRTDIAETDFRTIIAQEPNNYSALNALGYTLADQTDRYAEAKELIAKALVFQPDAPHILDSMGWVLYRLNDYVGAIEFLQRAYDGDPGVEIAAHLGEVLWVSGDQSKASQVWQKAYNEDAENPILNATLERFSVELAIKKNK